MERDTRQTVELPERYEPPAVEWEEPFDSVAASGPLDPDCETNPQLPGCQG
jgi:hypothetical protein